MLRQWWVVGKQGYSLGVALVLPHDPLPIAELTETSAREIQARTGGPFTSYKNSD